MNRPTPYYFLQTTEWMEFWKMASGPGHSYKYYENEGLFTFVYEYPWMTNKWNKKFWYSPKGFIPKKVLNNDELKTSFVELLTRIQTNAREAGAIFLKLDFDDYFTDLLGINDNSELKTFLEQTTDNKIVYKTKPIQYLSCSYLDFSNLPHFDSNTNSSQVYDMTATFWESTSKQVRRYTRSTIREFELGQWKISTDKTQENFEAFYEIHLATAKRQNFVTQSRDYLQKFFEQDFSRIIIIGDENAQAQCVWMGLNINNSLTYLLGGNTQISLDHHLQYLLHWQALRMCRTENIDFYDLGGHDKNAGYGQFKERYKPTIRTFLGPVDILLKPVEYNLIGNFIKLAKLIKK